MEKGMEEKKEKGITDVYMQVMSQLGRMRWRRWILLPNNREKLLYKRRKGMRMQWLCCIRTDESQDQILLHKRLWKRITWSIIMHLQKGKWTFYLLYLIKKTFYSLSLFDKLYFCARNRKNRKKSYSLRILLKCLQEDFSWEFYLFPEIIRRMSKAIPRLLPMRNFHRYGDAPPLSMNWQMI